MLQHSMELFRDEPAPVVAADRRLAEQLAGPVPRQRLQGRLPSQAEAAPIHAGEQLPVHDVPRVLVDECQVIVVHAVHLRVNQVRSPDLVGTLGLLLFLPAPLLPPPLTVHQVLLPENPVHRGRAQVGCVVVDHLPSQFPVADGRGPLRRERFF